jgi:hypothetical protein
VEDDIETVAIGEGRGEGHAFDKRFGAVVRDVDGLAQVSIALEWLARLPLESTRVFVHIDGRGKLRVYPGIEVDLEANSSDQLGRIRDIYKTKSHKKNVGGQIELKSDLPSL